MGADKNKALFQAVTRRICGNLNLSESLHDTFLYLKSKIPIDMILLSNYEYGKRQKVIRLIAVAFEEGGYLLDDRIILSKRAWSETKEWLKQSQSDTVPWIGDHTHPFNIEFKNTLVNKSFFSQKKAYSKFCQITCALKIKRQIIGTLSFMAEGENHYNQTHADLIRIINEPFAISLSHALHYHELEQHHSALQKDSLRMSENLMIGADSGLRGVRQMIEDVAPTDSPVLLLGDTGTGKEVVAGEIHKLSSRCQSPMVSLNCGSIPDTLVDSELFGHEKGAFTGALEAKPGRFERANGGTLFLDEVSELPQTAQVKLLRVLQTGEFERVGGCRSLRCDVRIIAATNRNMPERIKKGLFRPDLWYRLNVFPISIPKLKDRKQDIPAMVDYFIKKKCREMNLSFRPDLTPGAMHQLTEYNWPGNVRELQNIIERALIVCKGRPLSFSDLGLKSTEFHNNTDIIDDTFSTFNEVMAAHIKKVLNHTRGKISGPGGAAEILDLHPNTLRHRMTKLNIQWK